VKAGEIRAATIDTSYISESPGPKTATNLMALRKKAATAMNSVNVSKEVSPAGGLGVPSSAEQSNRGGFFMKVKPTATL
jgi:hypothetical protein